MNPFLTIVQYLKSFFRRDKTKLALEQIISAFVLYIVNAAFSTSEND